MISLMTGTIDGLLILTFIIGVISYKKYKETLLKYFLWFLGYGLLTEFLGTFFYDIFNMSNNVIYNIYALVQFVFFIGLFYNYIKSNKIKRITKLMGVITILFFIFNTLFLQNIFLSYQSYFFFLGGIFLIIIIILFFIEVLNSDAILKTQNLLIFWVAAGIFLFQLGFMPVFLSTKYVNYSNGLTYGYILIILNLISCTCYSLGFIWSKKGVDY